MGVGFVGKLNQNPNRNTCAEVCGTDCIPHQDFKSEFFTLMRSTFDGELNEYSVRNADYGPGAFVKSTFLKPEFLQKDKNAKHYNEQYHCK